MSQKCSQDAINKAVSQRLETALSSTSDVQQQNMLNAALVSAGLPQNRLNALIETARDRLVCDSDCQKGRESESLKKIWDKSKANLRNAPSQESIAEKNYYVFKDGEQGYRDMLFKRYTKTADQMRIKSLSEHDTLVAELKALLADYEAETIYSKRMNELLRIRVRENKELKNAIEEDVGITLTNDRKFEYESEEFQGLKSVRKGLMLLYYLILVLYLILGNFFRDALYRNWKVWLAIIGYIAFPFTIYYIVIFIYYIIGQISFFFSNKAPKNVYEKL